MRAKSEHRWSFCDRCRGDEFRQTGDRVPKIDEDTADRSVGDSGYGRGAIRNDIDDQPKLLGGAGDLTCEEQIATDEQSGLRLGLGQSARFSA